MPVASNRSDRIGKLFRRQPPHLRTSKDVLLRLRLSVMADSRELVGLRANDSSNQVLQVVAIGDKIRSEPVQQFRIPRLSIHFVYVFYQAATEQPFPEA